VVHLRSFSSSRRSTIRFVCPMAWISPVITTTRFNWQFPCKSLNQWCVNLVSLNFKKLLLTTCCCFSLELP
jgi:hypothetical protein